MNTVCRKPSDVIQKMKAFQKSLRSEIEQNLITIVNDNGGSVDVPKNKYMAYPSIYNDDAHASILELKKVFVNKKGRIELETDEWSAKKRPHCDNVPVSELLQIWDILLNINVNPFHK